MPEFTSRDRFALGAGSAALDLINTRESRLDERRARELLDSYASVVDWCVAVGLATDEEGQRFNQFCESDSAAAELETVLVLQAREALYSMLLGMDDEAARRLAQLHREATATATLRVQDWAWRWADVELTVQTPRHRLVRMAVDFAQHGELERLYQCEDERCGHVFLDLSPRRNRRWCSKECGERNRSRAYYARQKANGS